MSEPTKNRGGRPASIAKPWLSLAQKLGGVGAMAAEFKSSRRTVNQWENGDRVPSRLTQAFIVSVFVKHGISSPIFGKKA